MQKQIYKNIINNKQSGIKSLAILLDPDKVNFDALPDLIHDCIINKVAYIFVGGSLISSLQLKELVATLKTLSDIPIILFPGNSLHIEPEADAILLLSLISGRNSEFLIGQHVISAPILKASKLEILSTGYMLIDSGQQTTASYISNTTPIPRNKPEIAACTAMAGEMIGHKLMYLDGGSGAKYEVSAEMIEKVRKVIECPLIVGGGINTTQKAFDAWEAGADIVVVGNKVEQNPNFISELGNMMKEKSLISIGASF